MSGARDDGGPAFPRTGEGVGNPAYDAPGMTLRDWFAGQALVGLIAHPKNEGHASELSLVAYAIADAMLKERSK